MLLSSWPWRVWKENDLIKAIALATSLCFYQILQTIQIKFFDYLVHVNITD